MSLLSGFKSFKKHIPSDDGASWQPVSMITLAKDVLLGDGSSTGYNMETEMEATSTNIRQLTSNVSKINNTISDMSTVEFSISTSEWETTGDNIYPYSVTKTHTKYHSSSMPLWCLAGTGANSAWLDVDNTANTYITKLECGEGTITFYATKKVTSNVKILVKGV